MKNPQEKKKNSSYKIKRFFSQIPDKSQHADFGLYFENEMN